MQPIVLPLAALALLGAAEPAAPPPAAAGSTSPAREMRPLAPSPEQCRDRITLAREAAGMPPLPERNAASPEEAYLIAAVDKRVDGCAVMVIHGNVADMRPLPAVPEGPARLVPLPKRR